VNPAEGRWSDRRLDAGLVAAVAVGAVLRLVMLGRPATLSPDEAYTAWTASLPFGDIASYVRATDPHPPLYYFLLWPVAAWSSAETVLRLPSALCSGAAVAVMAWWQRDRGAEGLLATSLLAVLPFALAFGTQVRMYGLLQLAGVTAAAAAARWLVSGRRRWIAVAAVAGLTAALSHATGPLVLLGLLAVPGWRRRPPDSRVWWLAVTGAGVAYAAAWGAAALEQRGASLYETVTPDSAAIVLNETVAALPGQRGLVVAALVAGTAFVLARRDVTARVVACLYVVPVLVALVAGTRMGVFIPKTLVAVAWGGPVALAGLVAAAARWRIVAGAAVLVVVLLLVLPALPPTLAPTGAETIVGRLAEVARDGDVVANHPLDNVMRWYIFRDADGRLRPAPTLPWPDTTAARVGDAPFSGRVWLVDSTYLEPGLPVTEPACAPPEPLPEGRLLRCVLLR
jgi:hypothetical protein